MCLFWLTGEAFLVFPLSKTLDLFAKPPDHPDIPCFELNRVQKAAAFIHPVSGIFRIDKADLYKNALQMRIHQILFDAAGQSWDGCFRGGMRHAQ